MNRAWRILQIKVYKFLGWIASRFLGEHKLKIFENSIVPFYWLAMFSYST